MCGRRKVGLKTSICKSIARWSIGSVAADLACRNKMTSVSRKLWAVTTPTGRLLHSTISNGRSHSFHCMHMGLSVWSTTGLPPPVDAWVKKKKSLGFRTVSVRWRECAQSRYCGIVNPHGVVQWESVRTSRRQAWLWFMMNRQCSGQLEAEYWGTDKTDLSIMEKWRKLKESQGYRVVPVKIHQERTQ